jgi:hypothetical protein
MLFHTKINLRNSASRWFLLQEYITMHGPLNVKFEHQCSSVNTLTFTNEFMKGSYYFPIRRQGKKRNSRSAYVMWKYDIPHAAVTLSSVTFLFTKII